LPQAGIHIALCPTKISWRPGNASKPSRPRVMAFLSQAVNVRGRGQSVRWVAAVGKDRGAISGRCRAIWGQEFGDTSPGAKGPG